ncbi:diguanylate cyclase (GGDEF)-like protein/PAS domain S-box-containing protein [Comamonas sp. BIGb0152]|uniref:diguanylate cyclase domain-containing protein n=1 Tax=Comamonas sp. BIGb0152 TaxID=2940601 RepID=UPI002167A68E|nr:diguanylate cyclase [Comamonas sp. BIGb0152]MCS4295104.1 diguanylate cyclase (GGDEF)-like protein/PAS domain S-box-containing protein [Comamonas sp. BIGb0152]
MPASHSSTLSPPEATLSNGPALEPVAARARSLSTYLVLLMLAAALPILAAGIYTVQHVAQSYRDSSLNRMLDITSNLGHAAESDLLGRAAMLQSLAADGNFLSASALDRWMRLTGLDERSSLMLLSPDQAQPDMASSSAAQLLPGHRSLAAQALRSSTPAFSQLFFQNGIPVVAMAVRVGPASQQVLVLTTPPAELVSTAPSQTSDGVLIAITDGEGRILARSAHAERFIGTTVPDWERLQAVAAHRGSFEAQRADGGRVIFSFYQLPKTPGWVVVAGEPLEAFNARWQRPVIDIVLASLLALAIAGLLCAWLSRQLLRPIRQLTISTRTGASYTASPSAGDGPVVMVREFEMLRQSLSQARAQLDVTLAAQHQAAAALAASEQRARTLAHAGASVQWSLDAKGRVLSIVGWQALGGTPDAQALQLGWLRHVHPEDAAQLKGQAEALLLDASRSLDVELRLRTQDGQWRWMRARGAAILDAQQCIAEWLGVLEDVDDRKRAQAEVAYLALHDPLTGLPNRSLLQKPICTPGGTAGALLYLDLDRFKQVNDTLGHASGDALLCAVAERLRELLRDTDLVVRMGGDEFCIVQNASSAQAAASLAQRVIDRLSADYEIEGQRVSIGVSVGIALLSQAADTQDPDSLLRKADMALYQAKQQGRGRYAFYAEALGGASQ